MSYKFRAQKSLAVIAAYPDLQAAPQLVAWLRAIGVPSIMVHRCGDGRMDCGYNVGVRIAMASKFNQFIFADKDIWPGPDTEAFLHAKADLVSCEYDTGQPGAWDADDSFHTGLWRCRRRVLEAVGIRPFEWRLNEAGTDAVECLCRPFARRASAAGMTIVHAGTARHTPRVRCPLPMQMALTAASPSPG